MDKQNYNILVVSSDETERQELIEHLTVSNPQFHLSGVDAIGKLDDAMKGTDGPCFSVVIASIELSDAAGIEVVGAISQVIPKAKLFLLANVKDLGKYHRDLDHNIIFDIMCRPLNLPYVYHCVEMSISLD